MVTKGLLKAVRIILIIITIFWVFTGTLAILAFSFEYGAAVSAVVWFVLVLIPSFFGWFLSNLCKKKYQDIIIKELRREGIQFQPSSITASKSKERPPSLPPPIREREIIVREVVLIPCAYCGGLMPQASTVCPNCGAKRKN